MLCMAGKEGPSEQPSGKGSACIGPSATVSASMATRAKGGAGKYLSAKDGAGELHIATVVSVLGQVSTTLLLVMQVNSITKAACIS